VLKRENTAEKLKLELDLINVFNHSVYSK